jgi:(S)-2-hydroxyglutarate dehydrogenase
MAEAEGEFDIVVIGAGLVGLATAMALLQARPELRLAVVEKEDRLAAHQSGHNSGVVHAGLYYTPGSLKARFCREGRLALLEFADRHDIPYALCGKVVVAVDEGERQRFDHLLERGKVNGLTVRAIDGDELAEFEPNVRGIAAFRVDESGVIDYTRVAVAYADVIRLLGGTVALGHEVLRIEFAARSATVRTDAGDLRAGLVVACGGLQSDRLAAMTNAGSSTVRIVPFRGDYYTFRPRARELVRGLVYPVPDPAFPFLGVHFTRGIDGGLTAGPNAVPAFARERYRRLAASPRDLRDVIGFPGFWRLSRAYAKTGALEIWRDVVKPAYVAQMRRYVPAVEASDVVFGPSGIRAQALSRDGSLLDDFLIEESERAIHVLNAPSPAATASIVIGRHVAERAIQRLGR